MHCRKKAGGNIRSPLRFRGELTMAGECTESQPSACFVRVMITEVFKAAHNYSCCFGNSSVICAAGASAARGRTDTTERHWNSVSKQEEERSPARHSRNQRNCWICKEIPS
ncbi:hypothetical protein CesoFtcFv8_021338 [Champsocephalus esox]|uniref:Uncharacterized protein n=1 Tax=Champsocephalus esox TaxID=159716 RepID=A0AAN8GMR2_9TELE|nr:hypothetical protein CesoFtcFv8_021338 [Champsocephalus esox]